MGAARSCLSGAASHAVRGSATSLEHVPWQSRPLFYPRVGEAAGDGGTASERALRTMGLLASAGTLRVGLGQLHTSTAAAAAEAADAEGTASPKPATRKRRKRRALPRIQRIEDVPNVRHTPSNVLLSCPQKQRLALFLSCFSHQRIPCTRVGTCLGNANLLIVVKAIYTVHPHHT